MPTTVTSSIGTSSRDYSTLQAWEDACPADLVSDDKIWNGECYNDSEFLETSAFTNLVISGITVDATRYIILTAASGQSFQDNANVRTDPLLYNQSNGVGIRKTTNYIGCINVLVDYTRITRLQVKSEGVISGCIVSSLVQWRNAYLANCLGDLTDVETVFTIADGMIVNCVAIVRSTTGSAFRSIFGTAFNSTTFIGCLAIRPSDVSYSSGTAFSVNYGTASLLQSCAVFGFSTSQVSSGFDATNSKFNASDGASGLPGVSNQHSVTYSQVTPFTDADKDSLDLRSIAATSLISNGFYDGTNAPNDISNTARANPPTIGHWEVVAAGGGGKPDQYYRSMRL